MSLIQGTRLPGRGNFKSKASTGRLGTTRSSVFEEVKGSQVVQDLMATIRSLL